MGQGVHYARETVRRWRAHFFRAVGLGDPYIVMAQVYGDADPRPYGMDAAAGFPPHNTGIDDVNIRDTLIHPAAYHSWLTAACESTFAVPDASERIVFINAWNEWAEGAHLEPDRHLGYAYLVETARVMAKLSGLSDEVWQPIYPAACAGSASPGLAAER